MNGLFYLIGSKQIQPATYESSFRELFLAGESFSIRHITPTGCEIIISR